MTIFNFLLKILIVAYSTTGGIHLRESENFELESTKKAPQLQLVFRIRFFSGSNFFFLSPDPDRQKIRIRSEKSGSRSMKKRPKNGCTSKKMLHIAYLALKSQGCPNVSFLTLLRISELVSFR